MNKAVSILSVWLAAGTLAAMTVNVESTDPDRTITAGEVSTLVSSGEDLVKTGGGRFIIDRSLKGYKGEIRVEGGYLQALHNEAFGDTDKGTVISSGATLEFKNDSEYIAFGKEQFTVSGVGVDGCGAFRHIGLVKSQWTAVFQKVKLADDTRFGGVTNASGGYLRWDIRGSQGTFDMQGHDFTRHGSSRLGLQACVVTNNNDTHTSSISALYRCAPHNVTFAESNKVVGTSTDYRPVDMNTPAFNCAFLGGYLDNASTGVLSPAGNVGVSLGALNSQPWITLYDRGSLFVDETARDLHLKPESGATRDGDGTVHNAALFAVGDFEGNALKYVDGNPVPGAYSDVEILPPRDLYVDAVNGDDANDGLTPATAKRTLAAILSITRRHDTVHAARGDYNSGSETYDHAFYAADSGKGYSPSRGIVRTKVTLVADEGPDVTSITGMIGTGNGNNLGDDAVRCLTMLPNSTLRGFTLRNGATFHVTGNIFDNNVGGCILAPSCANGVPDTALIENCVISNGFGRNAGCVMGGILRRCTLMRGGSTSGASISMNSRFEHCFILNSSDTGVRNCGGMASTTYISLGVSSHPSNGDLTGAHSGARFENSILITKNTAATDGSHPATLKNVRNCVWAVGGDRLRIDDATSVNVVTSTLETAMLDAAHGYRPLAGSPAINAGDKALLANLAGDATVDFVGVQRVYDGEVDIGAYEYDIRPAMAALLYKSATVTDAAPAATLVGETIVLPSGEVAATFAFPATARFLVPVQVTGTGTFAIYVGDAAEPAATATAAAGATELRLAVPAGATARFVYEPGANDSGSAILGALVNASGMTVIFR